MEKPLILVVEDDPPMADHIAKTLEETERYRSAVAHNGIEAFEVLDKHKRFLGLAESEIKCVILDLKMPEMDGLQFIREFRKKEPFYKLMPIIILTAYEDQEKLNVTTSPSVGKAAAYLRKPFNRQELIDTVDRVFQEEIGHMIDETREKKYARLEALEKEKKKSAGETG
ncbi:MAG: response regulator [Candidatus Margulisbacteria bacterium]|nr:response regulator [Candidatus Margulisiibacteriota bacterium]